MTNRRMALAVFAAALLTYVSNASIFPLNADTAPNVYLPASVLGDGDLAFSPFEAPFMFGWTAAGREGDVQIHVTHWNQVPPGSDKTFAELPNLVTSGRVTLDAETGIGSPGGTADIDTGMGTLVASAAVPGFPGAQKRRLTSASPASL